MTKAMAFLCPVVVGTCLAFSPGAEAGSLHEASMLGDLSRIEELLAKGIPVDAPDPLGTPLQWAAASNQTGAAMLLLANGADPNVGGSIGTPLQAASRFSNEALVARLLQYGADPNHGEGPRPLSIAAANSDAWIVGKLLAAGADASNATDVGMTALHEAARAGSLDVVRALVNLGADVNALTKFGKPPIHYALEHDHVEVAAYLREHGWAPSPVTPIADLLSAADVRKGRVEFQACGRCCHAVADSYNIGPPLWNVVGHPIARAEGFDYSVALSTQSGTWTLETLNRFLARPAEFAPGTTMDFAGITDPERRANLIAYISKMSDDPVSLFEPD